MAALGITYLHLGLKLKYFKQQSDTSHFSGVPKTEMGLHLSATPSK